MKQATAELNDYRQSPRKVRLVAGAIRGKRVVEAKTLLDFITKRATGPVHTLLSSAIANAKNANLDMDALFVKSIEVNGGKIMYRRMPVAHGSANPIRKRTSHIKIVLAEKAPKAVKKTNK
jgi:large subunit ribosomal protein L22